MPAVAFTGISVNDEVNVELETGAVVVVVLAVDGADAVDEGSVTA